MQVAVVLLVGIMRDSQVALHQPLSHGTETLQLAAVLEVVEEITALL
jgi:hypothetical protein